MHLAVYLPLVMPLLAAAAARPLARRLPPAAATWLLAGSSVVLAAASSAVLGLLTLTALVRIPLVGAAGEMSEQVITHGDPASVPVAVAAGVMLAAAAAGACRAGAGLRTFRPERSARTGGRSRWPGARHCPLRAVPAPWRSC